MDASRHVLDGGEGDESPEEPLFFSTSSAKNSRCEQQGQLANYEMADSVFNKGRPLVFSSSDFLFFHEKMKYSNDGVFDRIFH